MFKTLSTSNVTTNEPTKVLLYAHHGWGKTYQCRYYQRRFGKGLILSGEAGLKSVEDVDIEYLPFSSWDGKHNPDEGVFSFRGIFKLLTSDEFRAAGDCNPANTRSSARTLASSQSAQRVIESSLRTSMTSRVREISA